MAGGKEGVCGIAPITRFDTSGHAVNACTEIYTKYKLKFYAAVFQRLESREASLSTVETFCVELIYALKEPTVRAFAEFAKISAPNAAYKVNSLIKKGYIHKVRNEQDKREYHLVVTEKYMDYYGITYDYIPQLNLRDDL